MSWTTTYRPQQISELSSTAVRTILSGWLSQGWVPQVLLFTGPKGTGKTTAARLLAATLNNPANATAVTATYFSHSKKRLPFQEPNQKDPETRLIMSGESFSVLEIDAASHRGIDNIRELKDQVQLAPNLGLMTVCILDEAHMLTKEAWNAFLKLLEEPPAHVVFVLATTELHKIPATIQSRCQVIQFALATETELQATLQRVCLQEKITVSDQRLQDICQQADGSVRDAIKLLERAHAELNLEQMGASENSQAVLLDQLVTHLLAKDEAGIIDVFSVLRSQGADERNFHTQFLMLLHQALLSYILEQPMHVVTAHSQLNQPTLEFLLKEYSSSALSSHALIPFLHLELKSLEIIHRSKKSRPPSPTQANSPSQTNNSTPSATASTAVQTPVHPDQPEALVAPGEVEKVIAAWQEFAALIHQQNQTLAAVIQSSQPEKISNNHMRLQLSHQFHVDRLKQPHIRTIIEAAAAQLALGPVQIEPIMASLSIVDQPTSPSMAVLAAEALL